MSSERATSFSTFVPEVDGVLSADEVLATARSIASVQLGNGMVPWFAGGHCDPWNHVESAMALTVCGLLDEAERAYRWLARRQLGDGSWFNYYVGPWVEDTRIDTNVCAYAATGLWHHALATGEDSLLEELWPMVERAVDFVLRWQQPNGAIRWSLDGVGRPEHDALLTGSCSIFHSLRCAVACAERLGLQRPDWELAAGRIWHAVVHHPGSFAPKNEFAMDWYYPVLTGVLRGDPAGERIDRGWSAFVVDAVGVRCVSTSDWVTAAETAECVLALDALNRRDEAEALLAAGQRLRLPDGSYWTGMTVPDGATFPGGERTTYTAAAMVLAADALCDATPAGSVFRDVVLPGALEGQAGSGLDLEPAPGPLDVAEPDCPCQRDKDGRHGS